MSVDSTGTVRPKAILVGDGRLQEPLIRIRPDWEFLPNVPNTQAFVDGLNNQTITDDIQVVLFVDTLFSQDNDDFQRTVARMAPFAMVCVINYQTALTSSIKDAIEEAAVRYDNDSAPVFFLSPKGVKRALSDAVTQYLRDVRQDEDVASVLAQSLPQEEVAALAPVADSRPVSEEAPARGKIVVATSSKGGSGKSTVCVEMGTYIAHASAAAVREGLEEQPLKVLILDLDVQDSQLGYMVGASHPTIVSIHQAGVSSESIAKNVIHSDSLMCDVLLAPNQPWLSAHIEPEFYKELLMKLREEYDYIMVDTSVQYVTSPLLKEIVYPMADNIIFVTDMVVNSVFSMTRWIQQVTKPVAEGGVGVERNKIGVVINKFMQDVDMSNATIKESAIDVKILAVIPLVPRMITIATNTQHMETALQHPEVFSAISRLGQAVVKKSGYRLSDNLF